MEIINYSDKTVLEIKSAKYNTSKIVRIRACGGGASLILGETIPG
jgi:hypothetical protein